MTDTLCAIDSIAGKLFKANKFRWEFSPNTVTYLNGTSPDLKTIQVKFNNEGKYTVHLKGWNSGDSALTFSDTIKTDFITVKKPTITKAYFDFRAKNRIPRVGEIDTLFVIDSILGKMGKANHFQWYISPNRFVFENGTNAQSKIIQVKFKSEGKYTVTLFGWNSEDSASSFNDTVKVNYIFVKEAINPKVNLNFIANNLNPLVGEIDTIIAVDTTTGKPYKANRFRWEFYPDKVTYVNGTSSSSQIIHIKFNEKGSYTIMLNGWNSDDSTATINSTVKTDYITVKETALVNYIHDSFIAAIYPNPSTGIINVNCFSNESAQIEVYNFTGKLISKVNGQFQIIDLSNEPNGIYLIKIKNEHQNYISRISIIK